MSKDPSIAIGDHLASLIAMQEHEAKLKALRDALIAGEDSGVPAPFDNEAFLQRMRQAKGSTLKEPTRSDDVSAATISTLDKVSGKNIVQVNMFELEESLRGASDEELLEDIRRSAKQIGKNTITMVQYEEIGKAHPSTMHRRFGSWQDALKLAGLEPSRSKIGINNEELFENIKLFWLTLGRQPRYTEVKAPASRFSAGTYENRFGSWSKALRKFVEWVNLPSEDNLKQGTGAELHIESTNAPMGVVKRRTRREVSDRQRFRILLRDGFQCSACGGSPLTKQGIQLHVDHILPWSKGGETTDQNLVSKCEQCNLGKGNAFNV